MDSSASDARPWSGHAWTVGPKLGEWLRPPRPPRARPWRRRVGLRNGSPVCVTGQYRPRRDTDTLVVVVHGLGGCADSGYCAAAARAIDRSGYASLRLSLRGANRSGDDIYHGGLTDDLRAALTAPAFDRYSHKFILGYSLGGHLALRAALDLEISEFVAAAAVCSPLDLEAAQRNIDASGAGIYREYLLRELRHVYRAVARRGGEPTPLDRIRLVRSLREWDALTVVPRFGFSDVRDYYERSSVGGELDELERPALLVAARHDPLVPPAAIEPGLPAPSEPLTTRWIERGGHVYFPRTLRLGFDGPTGLVPQILGYFDAQRTN